MLKKTLISCALLALLSFPAVAGEWQETMKEFPAGAEFEIRSNPTFNVTVGDRNEVVVCKAKLILRTSDPYVTEDGKRRVDLEVVDWGAVGQSELLGELKFSKREGPASEKSWIESFRAWTVEQPQDFPALAQFAVPYQLETQFGTVTGLYGVTRGHIHTFPPSKGDIFTMQKGDTAQLMAALMPEPVSALSAAGEVTPVNVAVRPADCKPIDE